MLTLEYPTSYAKNVYYRKQILKEAAENPRLQSKLMSKCRRDVLFYYNVFAWTYDPRRLLIKTLPFITYDYQDEVILWDKQCAVDQEDNLLEKSRDMGATWIMITDDFHDWLFMTEKFETRWGSRKEDYVDTRGDMDSHFEKFRHLIRYTPNWMLPNDFNPKDHDNYMRLINPNTGSSITGESANANFGRGGRKYRVRFDELAFWENDEAAWQACADVTECRSAISTPKGSGNKFCELATKSNINRKSLHWTQHPRKNIGVYRLYPDEDKKVPIELSHNPDAAFMIWQEVRLEAPPADLVGGLIRSPWYDAECERRHSNKEVAEELDIDYLQSGMPFYDRRMLNQQLIWEPIVRRSPADPKPRGYYITVNLVEIDNNMEIREGITGWLRIFEFPVSNTEYIVSGDTSEGLEKGDESFGVVRDKWTRNVVAAFNGLYDPDDFAIRLYKAGKYYNNAMVACENNNHGYSVNSDLNKMDCYLYHTKTINPKTGKVSTSKKGFTTDARRRPEMLDQSREEVRKFSCEIRDPVIIGQMHTFVHNDKNGKPEADGNYLDDGVLSYAIGSKVISEHPPKVKSKVSAAIRNERNRKKEKFRFGKR